MSSVFFSSSSQNALTVLRGVDRAMDKTQNAIATGKRINTAADNPTLWAAAQKMQSDQASYTALSETLASGKAVISLGRATAESIGDLLSEAKTQIIDATATGANTSFIQSTIDDIVSQVDALVAGASLNGVNLLQNAEGSSSSTFSILGSVYAGSSGSIETQQITVAKQDLQTAAASFGADPVATLSDYIDVASASVAGGGANSQTITFQSGTVAAGASYGVTLTGGGGHAFGATGVSFEYVARAGDTEASVAAALQSKINDHISANNLGAEMSVALDSANGAITITNLDADAADTIDISTYAATGGTVGGALEELAEIDVTTAAGRDSALVAIETLIQTVTETAATLGSAENRVDIQSDFLASASLEIASGISAMVDADLTAESARLEAQRAQRALALEMISIANDREESILSLFK